MEERRRRLVAGVPSALALSTQAADLADQLQLRLPLLNVRACLERFAANLGIPEVSAHAAQSAWTSFARHSRTRCQVHMCCAAQPSHAPAPSRRHLSSIWPLEVATWSALRNRLWFRWRSDYRGLTSRRADCWRYGSAPPRSRTHSC